MTNTKLKPFASRLRPAPIGGGFRMDDTHWVWCGSVVKAQGPGEDGRYHLFAARWPKAYPFFQGYLACSEVVRASADAPQGPYHFEEVVLRAREVAYWDGRMTHNPYIIRHGNRYYLYYIGTTYDRPVPTPQQAWADHRALDASPNGRYYDWYKQIRIGVAWAERVTGPWHRPASPTFDVNPAGWDRSVVTNPSPCVTPDGRVLLIYRSNHHGPKLGLAEADHPLGPYQRIGDGPVLDLGRDIRIEDPCPFWLGDHYEMVAKDLTGRVTGEFHAGIHLASGNGRDWRLAPEPKAWSRTVRWSDGVERVQANLERPFVLIEDGRPRCLFAATADGPGPQDGRPGFNFADNTWNMTIPLA